MRLHLNQVIVDLISDNKQIQAEWERLFQGWLTASDSPAHLPPTIRFVLQATKKLPALPPDPPFFTDAILSDSSGILAVYRQQKEHVLLHFLDGALVVAPLHDPNNKAVVELHGWVTPPAIQNGRFEDVTFTSLAPALRRQGFFLVHAFAAARDGRCVLIVGSTHSGKTTTGLNLLLNGWDLLANDVVMLRQQGEHIYAYPTPGDVGIRPPTFGLLPQLSGWLPPQHPRDQAVNIAGHCLVNGRWGSPCPVAAIFLPQITAGSNSYMHNLPRAVGLAHLMQESIDRWDTPYLHAHINILQQLCKQANSYTLQLGQDMAQIPRLIATIN